MTSRTPDSRAQLLSRLRADQSERWRRGERVGVEHYLARHPELAADFEAVLALIHSEMALRRQGGEQPSLDDYLRRFPQHADALRRAGPPSDATQTHADSAAGTTLPEAQLPAPAPPPSPPLVLPGLELHEQLGEGGMGVVYRARDVRLDRPRAIKVIRRGPFVGDEARDRFNREARAVARLDHAGVVRIYALGEHEGLLYICMEYLEGGSLQTRLRQGPLEVRAAADLVRRLALAVQHAHDNRVLHRDLKPGNVLLSADGTPKVGDFGLAKLLDIDDDLTHAGAVLGTPSYMAPEQAEGRSGDVREPTDVWSLGAILYECLTGRPPFKGETRSETLEQVKRQAPEPPRRLRPEVPAGLEAICLKCLEKEPRRRYATAGELADDLRNWLDGKARSVRRRHRHWRAAAVVAVLLAALCGAAWLVLPRDQPRRGPVVAPAPELPPAPGVRHPLLTREPTPLLWPEWDKNKKIHYDPQGQEVQVSCQGLALIPLGEVAAARYQVAVTLEQHPWVGKIGLFFGYRDGAAGGPGKPSYQVLALSSVRSAAQGQPVQVDWHEVSHRDAAKRDLRDDRTIANSDAVRLAPGQHRLTLTVGPEGLEEVRLDADLLRGLSAAGAAARGTRPPPPEDYRGLFGIHVENGNGVFREASYLFEGPQ